MNGKRLRSTFLVCAVFAACSGSTQPDGSANDAVVQDTASGETSNDASSDTATDATNDLVATDAPMDAPIDAPSDAIVTDQPNPLDAPANDVGDTGTLPTDLTQTLVKTCVLTTSCTGSPGALGLNCQLITLLFGELSVFPNVYQPYTQQVLACVQSATNCASYESCLAGTYADYCTNHPGTARVCVGNTLVDCTANMGTFPNVQDCALSGQTCNTLSDGTVACGDGQFCAPNPDGGSAPTTCTGNNMVSCNGSAEQSYNCGSGTPAATCVQWASGSVCLPNDAPACTGAIGTVYCDGNKIAACLGSQQLEIDCSRFGATCVPSTTEAGMPTASCTAPPSGGACTSGMAECAGTHLRYCQFGAWVDVDCTSIGFRTCGIAGDGGFGSGPLCMQ